MPRITRQSVALFKCVSVRAFVPRASLDCASSMHHVLISGSTPEPIDIWMRAWRSQISARDLARRSSTSSAKHATGACARTAQSQHEQGGRRGKGPSEAEFAVAGFYHLFSRRLSPCTVVRLLCPVWSMIHDLARCKQHRRHSELTFLPSLASFG
jgi:hypothetical protein